MTGVRLRSIVAGKSMVISIRYWAPLLVVTK
jgi:hypothetical protein